MGANVSKSTARSTKTPLSKAPIRSHRDLEAYQRAMVLLVHIHEICESFPADDRSKLAIRMRRASEAIPERLSEGYGRRASQREFKLHLRKAVASANEMETHLKAAKQLGYVTDGDLAKLTDGYNHVGQQLNRLISTWSRY